MAKKTLGYLELHWHCPHCGTQNVGSAQTCISCGSPQPKDVVFEQQSASELLKDAEKIKAAQQAPDVHCPFCGTRNNSDAVECTQCGGDLKDGVRRVTGQVLGAFGSQPASVTDIPCPSCRQPNSSLASFCVYCGSPLQQQKQPQPVPTSSVKAPEREDGKQKKFPLFLIIILALVSIACITGILIAVLSGGQNEPLKSTVTNLEWVRRIEILELQPVTRENWRDDIGSSNQILSCEERYWRTQADPAPGAVEVCGTPYTVDQGNGYAEVVQDCVYEIYKDYCSYETQDWVLLDTLQTSGSDQYAYWAEYNLNSNQKTGDQSEQYSITLNADGQVYRYQTSDFNFYQQVEYGSEWWIETGLLGGIKNISPVD